MSHFAVLVIGDNVDEQLAPYHEYECTGSNDEYVQNVDITEEVMEQIESSDEEDKLKDALEYHGLEDRIVSDESEADIVGDKAKHMWGYAVVKDGKLIKAVRRTNPNRKWDWYVEGGRWSNLLLTKNGERCDSALLKDIDFETMESTSRKRAEATYEEGKNADDARKYFMYGIQKGETKEQYVERQAKFSLYALVKDGVWFAKGEMGWFGMSDDKVSQDRWQEEFDKLLKSLPGETRITVIDCHI